MKFKHTKKTPMCQLIYINDGETEIHTVREFEAYFKTSVGKPEDGYDLEKDLCLCQIDVEAELKKLGKKYEEDCGDWIVFE